MPIHTQPIIVSKRLSFNDCPQDQYGGDPDFVSNTLVALMIRLRIGLGPSCSLAPGVATDERSGLSYRDRFGLSNVIRAMVIRH